LPLIEVNIATNPTTNITTPVPILIMHSAKRRPSATCIYPLYSATAPANRIATATMNEDHFQSRRLGAKVLATPYRPFNVVGKTNGTSLILFLLSSWTTTREAQAYRFVLDKRSCNEPLGAQNDRLVFVLVGGLSSR
jgi:hypothetical protein